MLLDVSDLGAVALVAIDQGSVWVSLRSGMLIHYLHDPREKVVQEVHRWNPLEEAVECLNIVRQCTLSIDLVADVVWMATSSGKVGACFAVRSRCSPAFKVF